MGWIWLGLGLYGLLAGGLFFMQRSLLYFPSQEKPDPSDYAMPGLRVITTATEDGLTLSHWFKPPTQAEGPSQIHPGPFSHFAGGDCLSG